MRLPFTPMGSQVAIVAAREAELFAGGSGLREFIQTNVHRAGELTREALERAHAAVLTNQPKGAPCSN